MTVYRVKVVYRYYEEVEYLYYSTEARAEEVADYYSSLDQYYASHTDVEVDPTEVELEE